MIFYIILVMYTFTTLGQVAQAARRPGFDPGCRSGGDFSSLLRVQTGPEVHSVSYKISTGVKAASVGLANRYLPSAVTVNVWTLAFTSPVGLHGR